MPPGGSRSVPSGNVPASWAGDGFLVMTGSSGDASERKRRMAGAVFEEDEGRAAKACGRNRSPERAEAGADPEGYSSRPVPGTGGWIFSPAAKGPEDFPTVRILSASMRIAASVP